MIHLEEVTPENWRYGLCVSEEQKDLVSNSDRILARAWAYREHHSHAFVIYDDNTPVGMVLYYDCEDLNAYDLSQLFIDHRYQGKGFGREASKLVLQMMKSDNRYDRVVLCYIDGNEPAKQLYESLGFHLTGESDGDEIIMEKFLTYE
ncbi:MAG: GNAT family N-acetyltransferase [Ruminococcus sp.]|nr:GNAT family N-acetyltransferase [Ruminococcus sp.]